jgi:uncharacterized membrane protein
MPPSYNQVAGQSVERLAAMSDGIFSVGMTLLVLDLRAPAMEVIHSGRELSAALLAVLPQLVMYLMSFLTLVIFWVGQQIQLNHLGRSDRHLAWINIAFLFAVTVTPLSIKLLAQFYLYGPALLANWFNLVLLGGCLYFTWGYANRRGSSGTGRPPMSRRPSAAASSSPRACTLWARSFASSTRV